MKSNALSAKGIEARAKSGQDGKLIDGQGLRLDIRGSSRRWCFKYDFAGKTRELPIGKYPAMSLAEARTKRAELREAKDRGIDPALAFSKPITAHVVTFRDDMETLFAKKHRGWDEQHANTWRQSLLNHTVSLLDKPTAAITDVDVLAVMSPIWTAKNKTAAQILGRIRDILDHAHVIDPSRFPPGYINPCLRVRVVLPDSVRPPVIHLASMPRDELPAFYAALDARPEIEARAMQWMLLNGCPRTAEVLKATWSEIEGDLWHIPGDHTKSANPRTNKQTPLAMELLQRIRADAKSTAPDRLIFTSRKTGKNLSHRILLKLMVKMEQPYTVHGFRATFTGWAKKFHRQQFDEREMLLDHKTQGSLGRAYDREEWLDERRELCEWWSQFLAQKISTDTKKAA